MVSDRDENEAETGYGAGLDNMLRQQLNTSMNFDQQGLANLWEQVCSIEQNGFSKTWVGSNMLQAMQRTASITAGDNVQLQAVIGGEQRVEDYKDQWMKDDGRDGNGGKLPMSSAKSFVVAKSDWVKMYMLAVGIMLQAYDDSEIENCS